MSVNNFPNIKWSKNHRCCELYHIRSCFFLPHAFSLSLFLLVLAALLHQSHKKQTKLLYFSVNSSLSLFHHRTKPEKEKKSSSLSKQNNPSRFQRKAPTFTADIRDPDEVLTRSVIFLKWVTPILRRRPSAATRGSGSSWTSSPACFSSLCCSSS